MHLEVVALLVWDVGWREAADLGCTRGVAPVVWDVGWRGVVGLGCGMA